MAALCIADPRRRTLKSTEVVLAVPVVCLPPLSPKYLPKTDIVSNFQLLSKTRKSDGRTWFCPHCG